MPHLDYISRQTHRGMLRLPHVGISGFSVFLFAWAGPSVLLFFFVPEADPETAKVLYVTSAFFLLVVFPLHCYERAELSDKIEAETRGDGGLQSTCVTTNTRPDVGVPNPKK